MRRAPNGAVLGNWPRPARGPSKRLRGVHPDGIQVWPDYVRIYNNIIRDTPGEAIYPELAATILIGLSNIFTIALLNINVQLSAPRWVAARALSLYGSSLTSATGTSHHDS